MTKTGNHIISKFQWESSFDEKEKAVELQSRLSRWSRNRMPAEISDVFDRLCPPQETYIIPKLELDLGCIDYQDLEPQLSVRLRKQLDEKLTELIFHAKNAMPGDLDMVPEAISRIDMVESFLINGVMPWNYSASAGTLNQLLKEQLQENPGGMVLMLLDSGLQRENVRRRIAWQVSEENIIKIIEGVEPANSRQIISFSHEMETLQAKENIVQSGSAEFKKNLWFWVLNYLFRNHGSEFNKREFVKSSIRQMAGHYHVGYEELLELIESAITKMGPSRLAQGEFLRTLKSLGGEEKSLQRKLSFPREKNAIPVQEASGRILRIDGIYELEIIPGKSHLENVLSELCNLFIAGSFDSDYAVELQAIFRRNLWLFPQLALRVLLDFRRKDQLQKIIPYLLSEDLSKRLVQSADDEKTKFITYAGLVIREFKGNRKTASLFTTTGSAVFSTALRLLILKPQLSSSSFLELLLEDMYRMIKPGQAETFALFVKRLLEDKQNSGVSVFPSVEQRILSVYVPAGKTFTMDAVISSVRKSRRCQEQLADRLSAHFNQPVFYEWRKHNRKERHTLLNYFLDGGARLYQQYIKQYTPLFAGAWPHITEMDIRLHVQELFWKCLLDYKAYVGKPERFEQLLQRALHIQLAGERHALTSEKLILAVRLGLAPALYASLLLHRKAPVWFDGDTTGPSVNKLLYLLVEQYPAVLLESLKKETLSATQATAFYRAVGFHAIARAMGKMNPAQQSLLDQLLRFYMLLGKMGLNGAGRQQMQEFFFTTMLTSWKRGNWKMLQPEHFLRNMMGELVYREVMTTKAWLEGMDKWLHDFPREWQGAHFEIKNNTMDTTGKKIKTKSNIPFPHPIKKQNKETSAGAGIAIYNAGLVMVSNYIELLLERLGITEDKKMPDDRTRGNAVHFLQYIVTGLSRTEESFLPLNKVLCGLPLEKPVPDGIDIPDHQRKLIDGMLQSIIGYWSTIGKTSVDGFRGNWLVRKGLLKELPEKWELVVEKRPYDILMNKLPFSFSVIRYSWMDKPLHVNWPY